MTILIATVTKFAAWISQDTMMTDMSDCAEALNFVPHIVHDPVGALGAFLPDGQAPAAAPPYSFADKLVILPRLNMAMGCIGLNVAFAVWCGIVAGEPFARDIMDIEARSSELWQRVPDRIKTGPPLITVHIGYDAMRQGFVGFRHSSADGWRSTPIGTGHFMHPAPVIDDPEYQGLRSLWAAAAGGMSTQEFHVRAAENAWRSCRRGLCQPSPDSGLSVGGQLHTARLDSSGIHVAVSHEFPDYRDQLEKLWEMNAAQEGETHGHA